MHRWLKLNLSVALATLAALAVLSLVGHAAPATGIDPEIRYITVTAGSGLVVPLDISADGVSKTVFFNNTQAGSLTLTFDISGTPPLTLTAGGAFDQGARIFTTAGRVLITDVTYFVSTTHGSYAGVWYTATNTQSVAAVAITFIRDTVPPTGVITIADGADHTSQLTVTVNMSATDNASGIGQMRLSNDSALWSSWQTWTRAISWTLSGGNGVKTVYVQFKDKVGNISASAADTITVKQYYVFAPIILRNYPPIVNGDFEQDLSVGWRNENGGLPISRVNATADGTPVTGWAALLGNTSYICSGVPQGYAGLAQTFPVPSAGGKLKFRYFIRTQDASPVDKHDYDAFEVYVNSVRVFDDANRHTTGLGCNTWWRVPGPDNIRHGQVTGWVEETIDLNGYAGQTVTISFRNYSRYDNYYNTYAYLDNVRFEP
jgi:hypothetical protein